MTREEKIVQESIIKYPRFAERRVGFVEGALWSDEHPREGLVDIDNACKWLKENINKYLYNRGDHGEYIPTCGEKLFDDFRKAIGEYK